MASRVIGGLCVLGLAALAGCGSPSGSADSTLKAGSAGSASALSTAAGPLTVGPGPTSSLSTLAPISPPATRSTGSTSTASSASSRSGALAGMVIVVDPGHDGGNFSHPAQITRLVDAGFGQRKACNSTGTETNAGYTEAAYTFDVAQRLVALLRQEGAKVVMTRTTNTGVGPCINQRAAIGNAAHADAVLSIHGDGNLAPGARGFHVIIANRMAGGSKVQRASQRLGDDVRAAFHAGTGLPFSTYTGGGQAETHRSDIGGLNLSTRPAVMIETGNMRSAIDAGLLSSATFRQREAVALAAGLAHFLGR